MAGLYGRMEERCGMVGWMDGKERRRKGEEGKVNGDGRRRGLNN